MHQPTKVFGVGVPASQHGRDVLAEPRLEAPALKFSPTHVVPHRDDLPHFAAFARRQVKAVVVTAAIVGEWNPEDIPPVVADAFLRLGMDSIK